MALQWTAIGSGPQHGAAVDSHRQWAEAWRCSRQPSAVGRSMALQWTAIGSGPQHGTPGWREDGEMGAGLPVVQQWRSDMRGGWAKNGLMPYIATSASHGH